MNPDGRVFVLMYHRVGPVQHAAEATYAVAPERFAAHMHALAAEGYHAAAIDDLVTWLEGGPSLPAGSFVLTFDDGFLGVRDHAAPVLSALGWPYTVFLVTDLLGGEDTWNRAGDVSSLRYPLLGENDVRAMSRHGAAFHSHTCRHASLLTLSDADLQADLTRSLAAVQALRGPGPTFLAYPFGHADDRVRQAARQAGYRAGFSVESGFNRPGVDPFRIRRIDVHGTDSTAALRRKVRLGSNDGSLMASTRYLWRRALSLAR